MAAILRFRLHTAAAPPQLTAVALTLARGRACGSWPAPERLTIDLDATLLTAHSDKEGAEPTASLA